LNISVTIHISFAFIMHDR